MFRYQKAIIPSLLLAILSTQSMAVENRLDSTANTIAIKPDNPNTLIAGTNKGLKVYINGTWDNTGLPNNNIIDLAIPVSPPDTYWVVTGEGNLFSSKNNGRTFEEIPVIANNNTYLLKTISVNPAGHNDVYAGSKDGYILKSENNGQDWRVLNPDFPITAINTIAPHPSDTNTIYIGTGGNGVLKTTDGGFSWNKLNNGLKDLTVTRLLTLDMDASVLYAGTYGGGVFMSDNGGKTWDEINKGLGDTFVYSLTTAPVLSNKKKGVFTGHNEGGTEIFVGVFGGDIYKKNIQNSSKWTLLQAE